MSRNNLLWVEQLAIFHRTDLMMLFEVSRQQFRIHKICIPFSYIKYDVIAFPELNTKKNSTQKLIYFSKLFLNFGMAKYYKIKKSLWSWKSWLFRIWQWLQILILFLISICVFFSSFIEFFSSFLKHFDIFRVSWEMEMAYFYLCFMTGMLKTIR